MNQLLTIIEDSSGPTHSIDKFSGFKWTNQHLFLQIKVLLQITECNIIAILSVHLCTFIIKTKFFPSKLEEKFKKNFWRIMNLRVGPLLHNTIHLDVNSIVFLNPSCVCDREDSSFPNKGK